MVYRIFGTCEACCSLVQQEPENALYQPKHLHPVFMVNVMNGLLNGYPCCENYIPPLSNVSSLPSHPLLLASKRPVLI